MAVRHSLWLILLAGLLAGACYTKKEGCLDATATNLDVSADLPCDGCCVYPQLRIDLRHRFGHDSVRLELNRNYVNAQGSPFRIQAFRYYLSDFVLYDVNGQAYPIRDTAQLRTLSAGGAPPSLIRPRDVILVAQDQLLLPAGTLSGITHFSKMRFRLGLDPATNATWPPYARSGSALAPQADTMYREVAQSYLFAKLQVVADTIPQDTLKLEWPAPFESQEIELDIDISGRAGFDLILPLGIDYKKWFAGIDFEQDSEAAIRQKIWQNIAGSFYAP